MDLAIARKINIQLIVQDVENISRLQEVNPEAYKLYLQARFVGGGKGSISYETGMKNFLNLLQRAVEINQDFALGHAWISCAYGAVTNLKVDPMYDLLRDDPRFISLLKKVGLEK